MNSVLSAENLGKVFSEAGQTIVVLDNVNFSIAPGETLAIIGASGSGKTTLLQLLGGLDKPTSGVVKVAGCSFAGMSERAKGQLRNRDLGFVYQFHHLLPEFSALENVSMPLLIRGDLESKLISEKATHLLEQVGLQHRLHHRLGQLSGGERQRVAIGRALVAEPLCVLADEPTGNLDPQNAEKVLQLFFELQKSRQTSVVMVTHDPAIAQRAQRIFRIEDGKLIAG